MIMNNLNGKWAGTSARRQHVYKILAPPLKLSLCWLYMWSCPLCISLNTVRTLPYPAAIAVMNEIKLIVGIVSFVISLLVCACRFLCKSPDNPHSVMATTTDTMEDSTSRLPYRQQYPQHPTAVHEPCQAYQEVPFQPVPGQPSYPAQPVDPAEPMTTSPNHEQSFTPCLPPSYQDATGPAYHLQPMPSSQSAYLLDPLAQPQPNALPDSTDFLVYSACSPEFVLH